MQILPSNAWLPNWEKHPSWTEVIDLRGCGNSDDAIKRCASVLSGKHSFRMIDSTTPSLNGLEDVVADWFIENWGVDKNILIAGGQELFDMDLLFAISFVNSINSAFNSAIYDRSDRFDDYAVSEEILCTKITLVMN